MTENQKAYRKEINRIKRFMKRAEKRGFIFDEKIPELEMPKRVTKKQLNNIKYIKPVKLYAKARHVDFETGEITTAKEAIKQQRSLSAKKGAKTRKINQNKASNGGEYIPQFDIIEELRSRIQNLERKIYPVFDMSARKNSLLSILEDNVTFYSENPSIYENYLKQHEEEIAPYTETIEYASDQEMVNVSFVQLARLLNMGTLSENQAESMAWYQDSVYNYEDT